MRKFGLIALLASVLTVTGCAPLSLSPKGKANYQANIVAQRVGEFESAVIAAANDKAITQNDARLIVKWCVGALKVLKATPGGWESQVAEGWYNVRPVAMQQQALLPWVAMVDALVQELLKATIKVEQNPLASCWIKEETLVNGELVEIYSCPTPKVIGFREVAF